MPTKQKLKTQYRRSLDTTPNLPTTGQEERNIIEFPLGFIDNRVPRVAETDPRTGQPTGNQIEQKALTYEQWIAEGDAKRKTELLVEGGSQYGLPRGIDNDLPVAIITAAHHRGLKDPNVPVRLIWEFLCTIGWHDSGFYYTRFKEAIDRWTGIRIRSEHAWWNNTTKTRSRIRNFHLFASDITIKHITGKKLTKPKEVYLGWVRVEPELWDNLVSGNITEFSLGEYGSLSAPLDRRLYLYLKRKSRRRSKDGKLARTHSVDMYELARKLQCGQDAIEGTYRKYPAKLRSMLRKAAAAVQEGTTVISSCSKTFLGPKQATIKFWFPDRPAAQAAFRHTNQDQGYLDWIVGEILKITQDDHSKRFYYKVARRVSQSAIAQDIRIVKEAYDADKTTDPARFFTHLAKGRLDKAEESMRVPSSPADTPVVPRNDLPDPPQQRPQPKPITQPPATDSAAVQPESDPEVPQDDFTPWEQLPEGERKQLIEEALATLPDRYGKTAAKFPEAVLRTVAEGHAQGAYEQRCRDRNKK